MLAYQTLVGGDCFEALERDQSDVENRANGRTWAAATAAGLRSAGKRPTRMPDRDRGPMLGIIAGVRREDADWLAGS